MGDAAEFDFVCPECEHEIAVDTSIREALIANGCVLCGAAVSDRAFSGHS